MAFNFGGGAPATGGFTFGASVAKTTSTPAAGTFSFGATGSTVAPQTGFSFGGSTSTPSTGFSFGGAATTAATTSTGFAFGGTAAPAQTHGSTANTSATSSFSFGAPVSNSGGFQFGGAAAAVSAAPTFSLGAGVQSKPLAPVPNPSASAAVPTFSFGSTSQPAASQLPTLGTNLGAASSASTAFNFSAKPTAVATTTTNPSTGFSLGSTSLVQSTAAPTFSFGSTSTAAATTASVTVVPVLPTLSFGAASTAASAATAPTAAVAPVAGSGFSFKTGSLSQVAKTSGTIITTTSGLGGLTSVTAPAKQMSYKELEDTVDKWLHDLGEQEKAFLSQAAQVNTWDKQLIENGEKVTELNNEVERVKADQQRLDRELDFILSQQEELEELLQPIETQVKSQQLVQHVQHSDVERERTYNLADNIDAQLKRMMEDLREIIERINNSNVNPNQGTDETMAHIGKILNSHMDSLQWVDQNTTQLQKRLEDVNQLMETRKLEHDKTFHLSYDRD